MCLRRSKAREKISSAVQHDTALVFPRAVKGCSGPASFQPSIYKRYRRIWESMPDACHETSAAVRNLAQEIYKTHHVFTTSTGKDVHNYITVNLCLNEPCRSCGEASPHRHLRENHVLELTEQSVRLECIPITLQHRVGR